MPGVDENRQSVVTLDYIVRTVMGDRGETTTHNYQRYLQFAVLGIMNLNMFKLDSVNVKYLPVNDNMTVDLPADYIEYNLIGICDQSGRTITLGLDNSLCLPRKTDMCGNVLPSSQQSTSPISSCSNSSSCSCSSCQGEYGFRYGYWFVPHFRGGQYVGERYGQGGGFAPGYFRIDKERHQIVLNTRLCNACNIDGSGPIILDEIVLEYKSTGVDPDGGGMVPIQALLAMRAWVHLQIAQNDPKMAESKIKRRQDTYDLEFFKLSKLMNSFTKSELNDVFYRSTKLTPKR